MSEIDEERIFADTVKVEDIVSELDPFPRLSVCEYCCESVMVCEWLSLRVRPSAERLDDLDRSDDSVGSDMLGETVAELFPESDSDDVKESDGENVLEYVRLMSTVEVSERVRSTEKEPVQDVDQSPTDCDAVPLTLPLFVPAAATFGGNTSAQANNTMMSDVATTTRPLADGGAAVLVARFF